MKMYSRDGVEMMEIYSLGKEGNALIVKGKMMQSMPATIYVRPIEIWNSKKLLNWSILFHIPVMIFKGFWESINSKGE